MKTKIIIASIMGAALTLSSAASAQEKVTVNGNIDLVNNYVWRGMDQNSGFSVQPTLGLSYKGLSLSAWGSQSLTKNADRDVQELDIKFVQAIASPINDHVYLVAGVGIGFQNINVGSKGHREWI